MFSEFLLHYHDSDAGGTYRSLLHQLKISSVSAETCTAACGANGYPLAGLEFGVECCTSFISLTLLVPFIY
jgi:hypothetical protein